MKTFFRTVLMMLGVCLALASNAQSPRSGVGVTFTNHVVQAHIDADAKAFLSRANITNDLKTIGAVDQLVSSLKAFNLWTNFYGLYPMVGGSSNSMRLNLTGNSNNITFGTNWAYYSTGVSNKGILGGDADTGFNCTNFPGPMHVYAWVATNGMTTSAILAGADDGSSSSYTLKLASFAIACGDGQPTATSTATSSVGGNVMGIVGGSFGGLVTPAGSFAQVNSDELDPCTPSVDGNLKFGFVNSSAPKCTYRAASFGNTLTVYQTKLFFEIMNRFQRQLGRAQN